jgi:Predicted membrane protein (DUF2232)
MQAVARYIMRGRLQAILVAAAAAMLSLLLPPLNYISSAVVALVTLRKGWRDGLIIIAGAAAAMAAFASLTPLDPVHAVLLAGVIWLPVWMLSLVLRQTVSLSVTVSVAALVGCVIVVGVYLGINDPAQTWRDIMDRLVEQAQQQSEQAAADAFGKVLTSLAPYMTGMLAAALVLGLILSVFLARWWQALLYNPGGFGREFHGLRMGRNFALVALGTLAVNMAASGWLEEVAGNAMIVIVAAYLLHGLGLVHGIVAAKGIHVGWLIALYAVTLILPQSSLLLAAAAFVDSWMDIRARIKPSG